MSSLAIIKFEIETKSTCKNNLNQQLEMFI